MKQVKKLYDYLTPLKDEHMNEYLSVILKPFNITDSKVILSAIVATIINTIGALTYFSTNYLGISGRFALMLLIVLIVDFITGTLAAIKQKKTTNSRKGRRTIYKTGAYLFFIYVAFILKREIEDEIFQFVIKYLHTFILIHITFWELFSIDENLKNMGINLGITSTLKSAYENIKNIFTKSNKTSDTKDN